MCEREREKERKRERERKREIEIWGGRRVWVCVGHSCFFLLLSYPINGASDIRKTVVLPSTSVHGFHVLFMTTRATREGSYNDLPAPPELTSAWRRCQHVLPWSARLNLNMRDKWVRDTMYDLHVGAFP